MFTIPVIIILARSLFRMNGPEWRACLAKGRNFCLIGYARYRVIVVPSQIASPAGIWAGNPSLPGPSLARPGNLLRDLTWLATAWVQDLSGAQPGQPRLSARARSNPAWGPYWIARAPAGSLGWPGRAPLKSCSKLSQVSRRFTGARNHWFLGSQMSLTNCIIHNKYQRQNRSNVMNVIVSCACA